MRPAPGRQDFCRAGGRDCSVEHFSGYGMARQGEADARFDGEAEPARYEELVQIGGNYWSSGLRWTVEFRWLLLKFGVTQAALRRIPVVEPVDKRVNAVIIGVPEQPQR
jgi:hypothetical protein